MLDMPMWVGLVTADGEPSDGYARARVSAWQVDGNLAETEVAFVAGRDWGRLVGYLLAGAPTDEVICTVAVDGTVPVRFGDTVTVRPWMELDDGEVGRDG
jgi:hypothetical protein